MATNKFTTALLSLVFLVLFAVTASAAIATNTISNNGANNGGSTSSVSWNFDAVGAGCSNCALIVQVEGDSSADDVTGVTFNSVSMTLLVKGNAGGSGRWAYTYGLLAPASGSQSIVVSASSTHYLFGNAVSYSGVSGFGNTSAQGTNGTGSVTGNVTVSTANSWVYAGCSGSDVSSWSGTTNATFRAQYAAFLSPAQFDNNTPVSTGVYSMTISDNSVPGDIEMLMVELKASGGGGGASTKSLMTLGVGGEDE